MQSHSRFRTAFVFAVCALIFGLTSRALAQNAYFTAGTSTIDAAHSVNGNAYVGQDSNGNRRDGMNQPYNPIVNLVSGGSVNNDLDAYNSSHVNVSGRVGGGLTAHDNSQVDISGGSVGYMLLRDSSQSRISGNAIVSDLETQSNSQLNVDDGSFRALRVNGSSQVNISGGTFNGNVDLYGNASSQTMISGGSFTSVSAFGSSLLNITDGLFANHLDVGDNSQVVISGGMFGQNNGFNFYDGTEGSFTLVGYNLRATSLSVNPISGETKYALSGMLQGGTDLTGYNLIVANGSTFTLQAAPPAAAVPEPAFVQMSVLLAGCGAGAGLMRKRRAHA